MNILCRLGFHRWLPEPEARFDDAPVGVPVPVIVATWCAGCSQSRDGLILRYDTTYGAGWRLPASGWKAVGVRRFVR